MARQRNFFRNVFFSISFIFIFVSLFPQKLFAEFLYSDKYGYAIDLPEGFEIKDADGEKSLYLEHNFMPVKLAVRLFSKQEFSDANKALETSLNKLNADGEIETFKWMREDCSVAQYTFPLADKTYKGWGSSVMIPDADTYVVLLCYADEEIEHDCEQFILSVLDSLIVSEEGFSSAGLITTYAYPKTQDININIKIDGTPFQVTLDKTDSEASEFVIEREYAVLTLYAGRENWKEAWVRYYTIIERDGAGRLDRCAKKIYSTLYPKAAQKNPDNPELEYTRMLLKWVQDMKIGSTSKFSDLTPATAVVEGKPSDCDSRSILVCTLLRNSGIRSRLFVSMEYKHAIFGADIKGKGARISGDNIDYLLGETTAHVDMGLMAAEFNDTEKWIGVPLP